MDAQTYQHGPRADQHSLNDVQPGQRDNLGNMIEQLIWRGTDYIVYRSSEGIYVHFSDCLEAEKEQRKRFNAILPELCDLRYLTAQMSNSWWRAIVLQMLPKLSFLWPFTERGRALYEHNMAQAITLSMEGEIDRASEISRQALAMAVRRVTNDNRIRYVGACLIVGFVWFLIGLLLFYTGPFGTASAPKWQAYTVASMFGAAGAVFSIATRLQAFELKPCNDSRMNVWMSAVRVGMGILAAVALLLLASTVLYEHVRTAMFGPSVQLEGAAMLGFLGGFAERLVPNILRQSVANLESQGTPAQAARKGRSPPGASQSDGASSG